MTIHLFILEALVCAGLYTRVKVGGGPEYHSMTYAELRKEVSFLSQLFRGEFIFPPDGLDHNLDVALTRLEADQVLSITRDADKNFVGIELNNHERESGRENFDFYCFLIWPFIEASWLGAVSLMMLTPFAPGHGGDVDNDPWLDVKQVHDRAQLLGKTLYHQGDLSYFEAVNKETLKNAYLRFAEEGMIVSRKSRDAKAPAMLKLVDDWVPTRDPATGRLLPEGRLWEFAEAISQSRREGKNRRDGRTVQTRVLNLVDIVGKELWDAKARAKNGHGEREQDQKSKTRRRTRAIQPNARL
jgi:Glycerol-3-phosphate acyltransferase C-terminal region